MSTFAAVDDARSEHSALTSEHESQREHEREENAFAGLESPFAANDLSGESPPSDDLGEAYMSQLASPFSDGAEFETESDLEQHAVQALLAEFSDEEFNEALEALTDVGAARHTVAMNRWSGEAGVPAMAADEVEQWLESIAAEADSRLSTLAGEYGERTLDSMSELELEQFGESLLAETGSPLDAQEDFFKKLIRKVKKVAKGVVKLAKKGLSVVGRFLPIGKLLGAVRRLIRPLLKRVLGRAIGRLPGPLQPAARKLAKRFGLEAEQGFAGEDESEYESQFESEFDEMAAEFDHRLAAHLLAPDDARAEFEAGEYEAGESESARATDGGDSVGTLDVARRQLAEYFESAEHQADPTAEMEQFVPAVLPLVKLGVKIVGRNRVVKLVAGLIARLIRPMVGGQLAPVLSRHIASSGLALIGLEAEAAGGGTRPGADALVSVAEDTIRAVFEANPDMLENELMAAGLVHEAFNEAVARHLPAEVLRPELLADDGEAERGVWVMMPRGGRSPYRYRAYTRRLPILIQRPIARQIVLGEGETLEDRLLDAGVHEFPVNVEFELYETMPGGRVGHIAGYEMGEAAIGETEFLTEFEELDEASPINMLLPAAATGRSGRATSPRRRNRRRPTKRLARMRVGGVVLRRRSPLSMRLDLAAAKPVLTVRIALSERRAHSMAERLGRRQHVAVVAEFQRWVRGPLGAAMADRLRRMLARRRIGAAGSTATPPSAIADDVAKSFAAGIVAATSNLTAAAKDARPGVTLTFAITFESRDALVAMRPAATAFTVVPGRQRG